MKLGTDSKGAKPQKLVSLSLYFFFIKAPMCLALPHRPLGGQGPVHCSKVAFLRLLETSIIYTASEAPTAQALTL